MDCSSPNFISASVHAARFERLEKESLDRQNLLRTFKRHGKVLERVSLDDHYGKPCKVRASQLLVHHAIGLASKGILDKQTGFK